ncbi:MAG TPA: PRC-barrel domain-containing protein [Chloroflexota bacterium]|nr:PRC-barrel domain-containing protein [Chloroflexota bacterium]
MKAAELLGMPVISIAGARKLGSVQDVVLNPAEQKVVAIRVKLAQEGIVRTVPASEITVGRDAITIPELKSGAEDESLGGKGAVDLGKLRGKKALSHDGNVLGSVDDVVIDGSDMSIKGYEISKGVLSGLFGGKSHLPSVKGFNYGRDILMVPDAAISQEHRRAA